MEHLNRNAKSAIARLYSNVSEESVQQLGMDGKTLTQKRYGTNAIKSYI